MMWLLLWLGIAAACVASYTAGYATAHGRFSAERDAVEDELLGVSDGRSDHG